MWLHLQLATVRDLVLWMHSMSASYKDGLSRWPICMLGTVLHKGLVQFIWHAVAGLTGRAVLYPIAGKPIESSYAWRWGLCVVRNPVIARLPVTMVLDAHFTCCMAPTYHF